MIAQRTCSVIIVKEKYTEAESRVNIHSSQFTSICLRTKEIDRLGNASFFLKKKKNH